MERIKTHITYIYRSLSGITLPRIIPGIFERFPTKVSRFQDERFFKSHMVTVNVPRVRKSSIPVFVKVYDVT